MTKQADKGYILPSAIDPGATKCIRAYVPDDPLYIAAFWGSYEFLANWLAWERDAAKRGKDAAAVWRIAFERAREEWLCSGGTCGIMDIRQKPDEPCIIQKQTDCDGSWDDAVTMSLCVPKMRLLAQGTGWVIQQWDGTEWVTTDDEIPPFEDRFDGPYTPQWPDPPVGETGNCLASVNAAYVINQYMTQVAQLHVDAAAFLTILSSVVAAISFWVQFALTDIATSLITVFAEFAGSWQNVVDYDMVPYLVPILLCRYDAEGAMSKGDYEQVLADMQTYRLTLVDDYKRVKWALAILYVTALGNVGMSRFAAAAGITDGTCNEVDCGWYVDFDFTTSDWGWVTEVVNSYPGGSWVDGVGWRGVATYVSGKWRYNIALHEPSDKYATYWKALVEIEFDYENDYARAFAVGMRNNGSPVGWFIYTDWMYGSGDYWEGGTVQGEVDLNGDEPRTYNTVVRGDGQGGPAGNVGTFTIKRIRLFGTGTNPWE